MLRRPLRDGGQEFRHLVAAAGDYGVQLVELGQEPRQYVDQDVESLLRGEPPDAEQHRRVVRDAKPLAPRGGARLVRGLLSGAEEVHIDAIGMTREGLPR